LNVDSCDDWRLGTSGLAGFAGLVGLRGVSGLATLIGTVSVIAGLPMLLENMKILQTVSGVATFVKSLVVILIDITGYSSVLDSQGCRCILHTQLSKITRNFNKEIGKHEWNCTSSFGEVHTETNLMGYSNF
jgi:hypothetical protein